MKTLATFALAVLGLFFAFWLIGGVIGAAIGLIGWAFQNLLTLLVLSVGGYVVYRRRTGGKINS